MIKVLAPGSVEELAAQIKACPADFYGFWNMDYDAATAIRGLPAPILEKLHRKEGAEYGGYRLFYIRNKIFAIQGQGINANIYHLAQFFPGYDHLDTDTAQQCADQLEAALHEMKIWPKKLSSPIAIYESHYMQAMDLPTAYDKPDNIEAGDWKKCIFYAYNCAGKQWVETYQIGHWDKAYDYDLNSAYATIMQGLYDTRYMRWKYSDDYEETALYGWANCWVKIKPQAVVQPIMFAADDGSLSTPVGGFEAALTKDEIDFIARWHLGEVDVIDGWWCKPFKEVQPLATVLPRLLKYKQAANPTVKTLAKGMSTGLWGKFMEERGGSFGPHYNPFWAAQITATCRLKVAEFIYRNKCWDNVIAISVDGVLLDKEVPLRPEWKLSGVHEALAIGDGDVWFGKRQPRGITLGEIKKLIAEHPNKGYYAKQIPQVITLDMAMIAKEPDTVGQETEVETAIDLYRLQPGRHFAKLPQTGRQLMEGVYKSKPQVREDV